MGIKALVAALVALATTVAAAEERFGAWSAGCAPVCRVATPVEFGARLVVQAAEDGGMSVALRDVAPAAGTELRFRFPPDDHQVLVEARDWRRSGPAAVAIDAPHLRAAILERLFAAPVATLGWQAAGEPRTAEIPTTGAGAALAWLEAATGARVRVVDQEAPRRDWRITPLAFAGAVEACWRLGDAPVRTVLAAVAWTESEDALLVLDERGERRVCIARTDGSAVTAWRATRPDDPFPAATPNIPLLTLPPSGACYDHEFVESAGLVAMLSSYRC